MTKRLIVTADDFGRSLPINDAVEDGHLNGILTAASLMVTEAPEMVADAVERARRLPTLAVGLHVTLVDGRPALPPEQVPDLVEADGQFTLRLVALGTRIYLDRAVRRQVQAEMRAQFELFRATGLKLAHVDSHHHYHLHPTVFDIMLDLAVEYGALGIRVPWEPPLVSYRARHEGLGRRLANGIFHFHRTERMRNAIRRAGLIANDHVFGVNDSGAMDAGKVGQFIDALPPGLSEIYGHPATGRWQKRPMPDHYRIEDEYHALVAPEVVAKVKAAGIVLTSFATAGRQR
jgi:hopanoid biosynthesis associated protein HpnK